MKSLSLLPWLLLEKLINELLHRDPNSAQRLQKLAGKVLRFDIKELPFELTVCVDEHGLRLTTVSDDESDCWVQTELGVLPELGDSANLTRLIKSGQLDIEGDPMLAQRLVMLVKELEIDWEAEFEAKLGVLPTVWLAKAFKQSRARAKTSSAATERWVSGVLIDEKRLLPARAEFEQFKQKLQQLRADVERLERRLKGEP